MAVNELLEVGDFAIGQGPQMRDARIHRAAGGFVGSAVVAVGKHLFALCDVVLDLELKTFPFGGQALEDVFDDGVETHVGAGVGETCSLGPLRISGQGGGGVARVFLGVRAFVSAFDQAQVIHGSLQEKSVGAAVEATGLKLGRRRL